MVKKKRVRKTASDFAKQRKARGTKWVPIDEWRKVQKEKVSDILRHLGESFESQPKYTPPV